MLCLITGILYCINFRRLYGIERWILAVLILNIATDTASYFLIHMERPTHAVYNVLLPFERGLILLIYAANSHGREQKLVYYIGAAAVLLTYAGSTAFNGGISELHYVSTIVTGLILAALSYVYLRSVSLNTAGQSTTMLYFGLANLIYFTLMISALSALPLAQRIDNTFASTIFNANLMGYTLWSILLIIGIPWKRRKI